MACIPLQRDGYFLYALTAFCSPRGLVGLGTFFENPSGDDQSVSWYGQQEGCPVHVRLENGEVLTSISVFWGTISTPYLTCTTNRGRNLSLGPYISPEETRIQTLYNGAAGDAIDLFYEISPGLPAFTSLGIIGSPNLSTWETRPHSSMVPSMPFHFNQLGLLESSPWTSFTSQASYTDIKALKVCYVGPRCTGMLISYNNDSSLGILGQWYESTSHQANIVELAHQSNHVLRFSLAVSEGYEYVESIQSIHSSVLSEVRPGDILPGDDIIWLYAPFSDIILRVPA
ncbi:hypothetical protein BO82DRAFT_94252 [Aspergillus uvarum CBS 121591]|uniref:Uncharacterized protein n=1 Tax=Aspergillus uvarum CBS 121591 TaxID=1448315 RepID=A0A319D0I5_9EURO|nr:hypothetical protein BO82DRAFT_94252 [Aspergillus uvarum CBS 121591]PYH81378.1 hypothetical protein BO82DRAFT_94252 [Aspergillus uvarum CBS 121591]